MLMRISELPASSSFPSLRTNGYGGRKGGARLTLFYIVRGSEEQAFRTGLKSLGIFFVNLTNNRQTSYCYPSDFLTLHIGLKFRFCLRWGSMTIISCGDSYGRVSRDSEAVTLPITTYTVKDLRGNQQEKGP